MLNFRQFVRPLIPVGVVILLCLTAAPAAEANNGTSTSSSQKTTTVTITGQQDEKKKPAVQKPSQKSVLDADMLERPLSFFKNSFSPEEDEDSDDMFSHSSTVVIAVKALIASLLSTII